MSNSVQSTTPQSTTPSPYRPLYMTLAVATAVSGVFILLAAHQVLPGGINAISQLGPGGLALGGILLTASALTSLSLLSSKAISPQPADRSPDIKDTDSPSKTKEATWTLPPFSKKQLPETPPETEDYEPILFSHGFSFQNPITERTAICDFVVVAGQLKALARPSKSDFGSVLVQTIHNPMEMLFQAVSGHLSNEMLSFKESATETPIARILQHPKNNELITKEAWTQFLIDNSSRLTQLTGDALLEVLPMIRDQITEDTARALYEKWIVYDESAKLITDQLSAQFSEISNNIDVVRLKEKANSQPVVGRPILTALGYSLDIARPKATRYDFSIVKEKLCVIQTKDDAKTWQQSKQNPYTIFLRGIHQDTFKSWKTGIHSLQLTPTPLATILDNPFNQGLIKRDELINHIKSQHLTQLAEHAILELLPLISKTIEKKQIYELYAYWNAESTTGVTDYIEQQYPQIRDEIFTYLIEQEQLLNYDWSSLGQKMPTAANVCGHFMPILATFQEKHAEIKAILDAKRAHHITLNKTLSALDPKYVRTVDNDGLLALCKKKLNNNG